MTHPQDERWDAGYPRVSTDMQVERDALQNQVQALEAHAAARGLRLRLYREEGVSAKNTDRPALQRLLADVRAGRIRAVIVTKLDRISRSLADLLDLMRFFEEHGVEFVSLRDNIDTSGPVGRFMLHILGAIAELERAITAERVTEDMKLRARRGKWNGGLPPYGRALVDGKLVVVPDEAATLHRMRLLLKEKRSWRGVAIALNREGSRTRGWGPIERDGRPIRKGHAPEEWTPVSVKRVLLQRINEGTLVYNRHRPSGRTYAPRPAEEHIVVEGFCEPIFSREELAEVVRLAAEIEGTPPRRTGSPHVLSGLVYCGCGAKMYPVKNYVTTKRGRHMLVYYRCRRASHNGTCAMRQVSAAILEETIEGALRGMPLRPALLDSLAGAVRARLDAEIEPLFARRSGLARERDRLDRKGQALLELAEDRLIGKEEFAERRSRLDGERAIVATELTAAEAALAAQGGAIVEPPTILRELRRLSDVLAELEETGERRRLLMTVLDHLVIQEDVVQLHVADYPVLIARDEPEPPDGTARAD